MKLAVLLPTRNKPHLLQACIESFRHLASDENEVKFFVRADVDDNVYYRHVKLNAKEDVTFLFGDPLIPTMKVLDIINSEEFKRFDPDIHIIMSDDVLSLTFHWDRVIVATVESGQDAFCWEEAGDPHNTGYIVLSKKYVQAMPSYLTTWFPFWFSDTWRAEVHLMAFGKPMPIIRNLKLGGRRGKTHGMKDVKFWFDFFAKTRFDRVREAEILAENFGIPLTIAPHITKQFDIWDQYQLEKCKTYEQCFGGNPSSCYAEAKKRAENYLLTK